MKKPVAILLVLVLLLVGGVAVFFTLKLDKPIFEAQIKKGIESMQEKARAQGRDLRINYETVDVQGNWLQRQGVINNLSMRTNNTGREVEFLVPKVVYTPKLFNFSSYTIEIPGSIAFKQDEAPLGTLSFDVPMLITSAFEGEHNILSLELPMQLAFTSEKTPSQPAQISFASKPVLMQRNAADGMPLESNAVLEGIKVVGAQGEVSIARLSAEMKNTQLENGPKHDVSYILALREFALPTGISPYGPFSFTLNINYIGELPKDMVPTLDFQPEEFQLKLNELSIAAKDFGFKLNGDATVTKADNLPYGAGHLHVENLDFIVKDMLATQTLSEDDIARIDPIFTKIAGTPLKETKHLDVALKREQGQVFHIGGTTGDEILMMAMPLMMGGAAAPAANAQDAAVPAPAAAPDAKKPAMPAPTPPNAAPVTPVTPAPVPPVQGSSDATPALTPPTATAKTAAKDVAKEVTDAAKEAAPAPAAPATATVAPPAPAVSPALAQPPAPAPAQ